MKTLLRSSFIAFVSFAGYAGVTAVKCGSYFGSAISGSAWILMAFRFMFGWGIVC